MSVKKLVQQVPLNEIKHLETQSVGYNTFFGGCSDELLKAFERECVEPFETALRMAGAIKIPEIRIVDKDPSLMPSEYSIYYLPHKDRDVLLITWPSFCKRFENKQSLAPQALMELFLLGSMLAHGIKQNKANYVNIPAIAAYMLGRNFDAANELADDINVSEAQLQHKAHADFRRVSEQPFFKQVAIGFRYGLFSQRNSAILLGTPIEKKVIISRAKETGYLENFNGKTNVPLSDVLDEIILRYNSRELGMGKIGKNDYTGALNDCDLFEGRYGRRGWEAVVKETSGEAQSLGL